MLFSLGHNSFSFSQKAVQRNRGAREEGVLVRVSQTAVYDTMRSGYARASKPHWPVPKPSNAVQDRPLKPVPVRRAGPSQGPFLANRKQTSYPCRWRRGCPWRGPPPRAPAASKSGSSGRSSASQADPVSMTRLRNGLDEFLERDQDRALFNLAPRRSCGRSGRRYGSSRRQLVLTRWRVALTVGH